jgi:carboxymethylenebutenolidase
MTPGIQTLIRLYEDTWEAHLAALLDRRDPDAALDRVDIGIEVRHLPARAGGRGLGEVRAFYRDAVAPHLPERVARERVSRTVDQFRLVQESVWAFRHDREMPWLLPGVTATGADVRLALIEVASFRQGRLSGRRLLWDQAGLLRQLGPG